MMTNAIKRMTIAFLVAVLAAPVSVAAGPHEHHSRKPCNPTPQQHREAAAFARATKAVAKKFENPAVALENDYVPWVDSWKSIYHFVNYGNYYDWRILDPKRPEAFVYAHTLTGPKLIGVMYSMEDPKRKPPPMGGCITRWHTHPQCRSPIGYSHIWEADWGDCPPGWTDDGGSELMLHVWTVPMKGGPYAYHPDDDWYCWPKPSPC